MKRIAALCCLFALVIALVTAPVDHALAAHPTVKHLPGRSVPMVTVPCQYIEVPYGVYSMPITQTETLTLSFQSSSAGSGLITFSANTYGQGGRFYDTQTDNPNCGNCVLTITNVQPPSSQVMQLALDVSSGSCPDGAVTIGNFQLQITPTSPH